MTPSELSTERAYRIAEREGLLIDSGGQLDAATDYLIQLQVDEDLRKLEE